VNGGLTLSGAISGAYNLTKEGSGRLNLTGANTYSGGSTTINAGTVSISGAGTLGATTNDLSMSNTAILDLQKGLTVGNLVMAAGNTITNSTGTATLTVGGTASLAGTITTSGNQTYTGAVTLLADTNLISNSGSGNGTITFSSTVNSNTGTNYALTTTTGTGSTTFASTVGATQALLSLTTSGDASLGGSVTTTGAQNYGANLTLTGTDINLNTTNSAVSVVGNVVADLVGSTYSALTIAAGSGAATIGGTVSNVATLTIDTSNTGNAITGAISGATHLVNSGSGTLTLSNNNTYTGSTTVAAGTLNVTGTLADSTAVTVASGATYMVNTNDTIASLAGAGNTVLNANLIFGNANDTTVSGIISGAGSLTKEGSSTVTLSNNNTYTGSTTVAAGTLNVTGTLADSTAVTVASGATYIVAANDTIASLAGAGNTVLNANLIFGNANDTTVSGIISGAGSLTKAGSSTVTLSGTNTYSGKTTISGGQLNIASDANLGTAPGSLVADQLTLNGGALFNYNGASITFNANRGITLLGSNTIQVNNGSTITVPVVITGTGSLTLSANNGLGGVLILAGNNTYSGATTITGGTLNVTGTLGNGNYAGNISNSGILNVNSSIDQTLSGIISGTGTLIKQGSGTVTLSNSNTYSGDTTINAGTIIITNNNGLGSTVGSTTIAAGATLDLQNTSALAEALSINGGILVTTVGTSLISGNIVLTADSTVAVSGTELTASGIVSGSYGISKIGSGVLTLSNNNTYTGSTTVAAGTLNVTGTLADSTAVTVASGATYIVAANDTIASLAGAGNTVLNANLIFGNAIDTTIAGIISGAGSLTKAGSSTVALSNNNTYTGSTTVAAGTLNVTGTLADSTAVTVASGATYIVAANDTIASLAGAGNTVLNANLIFGNAIDTTIAGIISGAGSLTKEGSSTVTLSGANTYSGDTVINAGTLLLGASDVIANTSNVIVNGGTLDLGVYSDTVGAITVGMNGGSIISSTGVLTGSSYTLNNTNPALISARLAGSASLIQAGSGITTLSGDNSYTGGTFINAGTLIVAADANLGSALGSISFNGGTLNSIASFTLSPARSITLIGNAVFNVNALTTLTFNGVIAGSGSLIKTGLGTLILGGSNSYSGATSVNSGAITITGSLADTADVTVASGAAYNVSSNDTINSVLGNGSVNLAANLSLAGNSAFTFDGAFTGVGSVIKVGSGTLTLSGSSSFTGETVLNDSRLILTNANALGSSTVVSGSGTLEIADGIVLSALRVTGPVTISSDVITIGAQTYEGAVTIAPKAGNTVEIQNYANELISPAGVRIASSNAAIRFDGTIDAASAKSASLRIDAGTGEVTIGDSVGSRMPLQNLYVVGGKINLLADVLTASEQTYMGTTTIGNNGRDGFLAAMFTRETRPEPTFVSAAPRFTRTLISMDPMVRFIGHVNPDVTGIYTLAVAAIYEGFVNGVAANEPRIIFDGLVGNIFPFYSTNFQTLQGKDQFMLAGKVSTMGVITVESQNYSTDAFSVTLDPSNSVATFKSTRGTINFDVSQVGGQFNMSSDTEVVRVIIDGKNNFKGSPPGMARVSRPVQEAAAAAAAANGGNLSTTNKFDRQVSLKRDTGSSSSVSVTMDGVKNPVNCAEENAQAVECK
jgi:autotransporter-associated beta strand protein